MDGKDKKNILLVEDELVIALNQKFTLENYGYNVITANSGNEAVEIFGRYENIDIILMDIELGEEMGGAETAKRILELRDIPVIFLSSYTQPEIINKTENVISYGYLLKSSGIEVFDASIKTALRLFDENKQGGPDNNRNIEEVIKERQSDYLLSELTATYGHWTFSPSRMLYEWSDDMYNIWARERGEGPPSYDELMGLIHPDDRMKYEKSFRSAVSNGTHFSRELRIRNQLDNERVILTICTPQIDEFNNVIQLTGTDQDITGQKLEINTLRESEKRFRILFNINTDAMFVHRFTPSNLPGRFIEVNNAACIRYGYTREEFMRMRPQDIDAPEGLEVLPQAMGILFAHGYARWEGMHISKNRKIFPVEITNILFNYNNEQMILSSVRDCSERRHAENAVRESEKRLIRAELISKSGNWEYHIDSHNIFISAGFAKIFGIGGNLSAGQIIENGVLPEYKAAVRSAFRQLVKENKPYDIEFRIRTLDTVEVKDIHSLAEYDREKNIVYGVLHDITERNKTEKALEENEKLLSALMSNIPGIAFQFYARENGERGFYYINERSKELLGIDNNKDTFYERVLSTVPMESRDTLRSSLEDAIRAVSKWDFESKFVRPDGEPVWIRGISEPAEYGNEIVFNGVAIDITERKNSERDMRLLNYSLDHTMESIFWLDSDAEILYVNDTACRFLGYTRDDLTGMHIYDMSPGTTVGTWKDHFEELKRKKAITFETELANKNGRIIPVEITENYISFEGREGSFDFVNDISEKKRTEAQLIHAQKMEIIGNLAGGLAHDFNNILSGITGPLSYINYKLNEKSDINPAEFREYLNMMYDSSARASGIIKQLLSLSKTGDNTGMAVDLVNSINNVIKICKTTFDKSVRLKSGCPPGEALVYADPTQVEQVLLNLCINSAHAMTIMKEKYDEWGGVLSIILEKISGERMPHTIHAVPAHAGYWHISVSDTGIGIASEDLPSIFDPFYTTKGKDSGTGLGLSVVYSIISRYHGFIDVNSEPGLGTIFHIYLPVLAAKQARASAGSGYFHVKKGNGRVLVIDDEKNIRKIVKKFLEECGYDTVIPESISEGMDVFRKLHTEIDAVLLDLSMADISARDALAMLKDIDPEVRILLTSGTMEDARINELNSYGIRGFIQKPFTLEKFSEMIYKVIHDD